MMIVKNVSSWTELILSLPCAQQRRVFILVSTIWRSLATFIKSDERKIQIIISKPTLDIE